MVQVLLSLGANVNDANNNSRRTPLFLACTKPYEKAEFLLVYGADIQAQDKHGFTVLHNAAIYGDEELVDLLLRHGADLDAQTEGRQTPWALAVRWKHDAIAQRLWLASKPKGCRS